MTDIPGVITQDDIDTEAAAMDALKETGTPAEIATAMQYVDDLRVAFHLQNGTLDQPTTVGGDATPQA